MAIRCLLVQREALLFVGHSERDEEDEVDQETQRPNLCSSLGILPVFEQFATTPRPAVSLIDLKSVLICQFKDSG